LVLGPHIEKKLKEVLPKIGRYISSIDHPYFFEGDPNLNRFKDEEVRFGFFGYGSLRKGADVFFQLADEVTKVKAKSVPQFTLIGQVTDPELTNIQPASVSVVSSDGPLSQRDYELQASAANYACVFHKEDAYALNASGSILDAFLYLKPIIALKSQLTEYYFNKMGDIGYLCEGYNELKNTVLDILNEKPFDRYVAQQKNILAQRALFLPPHVAAELKRALEWKKY
jgi:hypothetical protein